MAFSWRLLTTWFTVRIPPCQIRTSTLLNVQNYIVFYHVVSHALFYIGNWVLHCFSQYKMHVRFLPNYFDFSALAPFSFVHQTSVSDIKYVIGETFPTCLLYAHANTWFLNRSLKPLWQGSLAAILSGSHFFKRPQEWSNVCVPARLLIVFSSLHRFCELLHLVCHGSMLQTQLCASPRNVIIPIPPPTPPHHLRSIDHVCKSEERHHPHPTPHPTPSLA